MKNHGWGQFDAPPRHVRVKRTDNGKATLTVSKVNKHLSALQLDIVDNSNINATRLNIDGLHLNEQQNSEQQSCSSSCNLSHEKGFPKRNVAKF